jgi:hypothetical protein
MDGQYPVKQRYLQAREVQKRLGLEYYEWRELRAGLISKRKDDVLTSFRDTRHPRMHFDGMKSTQSDGVPCLVNGDWSSASNSAQRPGMATR